MNRNLFVKIFFTFGLENHLPVRRRKTTTMKGILLANKKMKGSTTTQIYAFAIRTSQHVNRKLQMCMLLGNALRKDEII